MSKSLMLTLIIFQSCSIIFLIYKKIFISYIKKEKVEVLHINKATTKMNKDEPRKELIKIKNPYIQLPDEEIKKEIKIEEEPKMEIKQPKHDLHMSERKSKIVNLIDAVIDILVD
jgi:hypothetical protein